MRIKSKNISLVYDKVGDFYGIKYAEHNQLQQCISYNARKSVCPFRGIFILCALCFSESLTEQDAAKTEVYPAHAFSVCVYDSEKREVRLGSIFDIAAYETDGLGIKCLYTQVYISGNDLYHKIVRR